MMTSVRCVEAKDWSVSFDVAMGTDDIMIPVLDVPTRATELAEDCCAEDDAELEAEGVTVETPIVFVTVAGSGVFWTVVVPRLTTEAVTVVVCDCPGPGRGFGTDTETTGGVATPSPKSPPFPLPFPGFGNG